MRMNGEPNYDIARQPVRRQHAAIRQPTRTSALTSTKRVPLTRGRGSAAVKRELRPYGRDQEEDVEVALRGLELSDPGP